MHAAPWHDDDDDVPAQFSSPLSGKIFGHKSVKILVFPSPAGYDWLWSVIWEIFGHKSIKILVFPSPTGYIPLWSVIGGDFWAL